MRIYVATPKYKHLDILFLYYYFSLFRHNSISVFFLLTPTLHL